MTTIEATSATTAVSAPSAPATPYEARPVDGAYTLEARPWFDIEVRREKAGYWTVADRQTGIFGHGDDPLAALQDFNRSVTEHLEALEEESELSEDLERQLSYLRERTS
jgi:hypothetical protein